MPTLPKITFQSSDKNAAAIIERYEKYRQTNPGASSYIERFAEPITIRLKEAIIEAIAIQARGWACMIEPQMGVNYIKIWFPALG